MEQEGADDGEVHEAADRKKKRSTSRLNQDDDDSNKQRLAEEVVKEEASADHNILAVSQSDSSHAEEPRPTKRFRPVPNEEERPLLSARRNRTVAPSNDRPQYPLLTPAIVNEPARSDGDDDGQNQQQQQQQQQQEQQQQQQHPPPPQQQQSSRRQLPRQVYDRQTSSGPISPASDLSSTSSRSYRRNSELTSPNPNNRATTTTNTNTSTTTNPAAAAAAAASYPAAEMSEAVVSSSVREVPPAPPSTPASHLSSTDSQASATTATAAAAAASFFPMQENIQNAYQLEQRHFQERELLYQSIAEGAETPAPPKRDDSTTNMDRPTTAAAAAAGTTNNENETNDRHRPPRVMKEDFSEWAVGDRYHLIRILGRGSYGEVAQALDLHAGQKDAYVAIKRIQSPFDQEVDAVRLYREIHILRRLRGHDCIINLLDVVQPPTEDLDDFHDLYLVFEYVDTDLYKLICSPQYLTTEHIQAFLYQMLAGLKCIHSSSVIHRDLKPANILLNEDCSLKICDFGLARIVRKSDETLSKELTSTSGGAVKQPGAFGSPPKVSLKRQLTKHVVTRWYRAPELILIQPYTSAVDIWSLGCILGELLSMQEASVPSYKDRKALFPGGSCYPLSGDVDNARNENNDDVRLDQLSVIFGIIGTPSKEDISAIGSANEYVETMKKQDGKPLKEIFPAADPAALDLLQQMLQFNPKRRCTAEQALEHPFFKGVRRKELEKTPAEPLVGPEFLNSNQIDLRVLKQKTFEEVRWYRDHGGPMQTKRERIQSTE